MPTFSLAGADPWKALFTMGYGQRATMTASGSWTWDKNSGQPWCGPGGNGKPASGGSPTSNLDDSPLWRGEGPQPASEGCLVWRVRQYTANVLDSRVVYETYFSFNEQSHNLTLAGVYEFQMNDTN